MAKVLSKNMGLTLLIWFGVIAVGFYVFSLVMGMFSAKEASTA